MAIMGERGIGKSSLLRKLEAITDHDEHIVVRRDMDSSTKTLAELVNFILAFLKVEGASIGNRGKIREFFRDYAWNLSVAGLGIGIDSQKSVVLQEFFYSELKKISDNTRDEAASICIMLDEAEHLEQIDGSWSFIRTVFSRLSENGANYLVIVAGKLGLFNKISEIFSPMERFFYPTVIGQLSKEEVRIISRPFREIGGSIAGNVADKVYNLSSGFPFVVQVMGDHLFESGEKNVDMRFFNSKWPEMQDRLEVQLFKSRYENASPREREVLHEMAKNPSTSHCAKDLGSRLSMKNNQVSYIFGQLIKKNSLMKVGLGSFKLFHPLFGEYIIKLKK